MRAIIDIKKTLRGAAPRIPFEQLLKAAFPAGYELSLVICGDSLARNMNRTHRKKTYAANVLSFPLSKTEGEIFLNARASAREARRFGVSEKARLALLFVHGLMHLKGLSHGRTMEAKERDILRTFGLDS
jgi:probable rRNA maturation factor